MSDYFWSSSCGRVELALTQEQIDSVCTSGPNDAAVAALEAPALNPDRVRDVLREYGAWSESDLRDPDTNTKRLLWLACWDCFDAPELYLDA